MAVRTADSIAPATATLATRRDGDTLVALSLLGFTSNVQAHRNRRRISTNSSLRFAIVNNAGRVVIRTVARQQWIRE